jgi:dTDP-4-amino-4,6-dideoxygalactose transaminase
VGTLLIKVIKDLEPVPFLSFAPQHAIVHDAVTEALQKGFEKNWYILGSDLKKFEADYAGYSNVRFCFGSGQWL